LVTASGIFPDGSGQGNIRFKDNLYNVLHGTVKNLAEIVNGSQIDRLVPAQPLDGSFVKSVLFNQGIGADMFFFHGFPQGSITYHGITSILKDTSFDNPIMVDFGEVRYVH
jgi:hypothetical protein